MQKLLILVDEYFEDIELMYPKIRLEEEGFILNTAALEKKNYNGKIGSKIFPDKNFHEININDYAGVIIPGGFAPDLLRRQEIVLNIVQDFDKQSKLVAFICHAGWVLVSAKILNNRRVTSLPAIKDDMINAGSIWEDSSVVIDSNFISSRYPSDLEKFCKGIIQYLNSKYVL